MNNRPRKQEPIPIEASFRAKKEVVVYDMFSDNTQTYTDISPITALLNSYILLTYPAKLHDKKYRAKISGKITFGKHSAMLNDFAVFIK